MTGKKGPVGAIVSAVNWNLRTYPPSTGGSWTQTTAFQAWNTQTGTTNQCHKIFTDTSTDEINACISLGINAVVCYEPRVDSVANMTADLATFTTSVNHLGNNPSSGVTGLGLKGFVVLWSEVENKLTGTEFQTLMQFDPNGTGVGGFHAAANAAGFPLYWDAAGSHPGTWSQYYPGAEYLDGIAVDLYCFTWTRGGALPPKDPNYLKTLTDFADHPTNHNPTSPPPSPVPFGIFEIGFVPTSVTPPVQSDFEDYMAYIIQLMGSNPATTYSWGAMPAGRLARGLTNGPVMWYDDGNHDNFNMIVPMPGHVTPTSYDTYAVQTAYPALYTALAEASTGNLTVTTTSLSDAVVGESYSATISATGGTKPYTWSLASGTLPAGLTLSTDTSNNTGVISGTPT